MTINAVKTGAGPDVKRIEFSDGSLFSFKTCYLSPLFFDDTAYCPGKEISPDEEERFRFAAACLRAEKAASRLVARAEQSVFGLSRKLEKAGHPAGCVRAVAARLTDLGILDDRRFARYWLRSRLALKPDSPRKLLAGLRGRGIGRDDAARALKEALGPEDELGLLKRYLVKHRVFPGEGADGGGPWPLSLLFQLKREGFSSESIHTLKETPIR
ncbi:MAG: RecX family transcriptional regulator [Treponema sp.]|jgi:regulatory protein|nr:RecX family transcriptional regulator [Treponema sp.]